MASPRSTPFAKGLWDTKQQKELLRQQNLQKEREAEAVALKMHAGQQVLVAPEEVERHKRKQSKREDEYQQTKARLEAGRTASKADIQAGSTLFFEEGCWAPCLQDALAEHGWRRVNDKCAADVQVAMDATAPHWMSRLVACLIGGVVCTPLLFERSRSRGPVVAYQAALRTKRYLWISPTVSKKQPETISVIKRCVEHSGAMCGWVFRNQEWLASCRVGRRAFAIVSKEELGAIKANVARGVQTMTLAVFLRGLVKLDRDRSSRGTDCGR